MRIKIWVCLVIGIAAAEQAWAASEVSAAGVMSEGKSRTKPTASAVPATRVMSEAEWDELATKRTCLMCHEKGQDGLGPSLKEIAEEYAGKDDAEATLLKKVSEGGVGNWGSAMMPSQAPHTSPEEIRALVRYMLHLK